MNPRRVVPRFAATIVALAAVVAAFQTPTVQASPPAAAEAPPPNAVRLSDQILDPQAHAKITYEGSVNVASFQQDGLFTYAGYQYVAWYRADGRGVIARRSLPDGDVPVGEWKSIELDAFLYANDSHNTISMAVSPSDGRLHVAFGTHANAIRYARSLPGLATDPDGVAWSSKSFERTRGRLPGAPSAPTAWTYPQFEVSKGHLLLNYREGGSGNGRQVLLRYNDDDNGTWTYLGKFTSSTGTYTSPFGTSSSRNAYLHGFSANPVTGDLEVSFTWREATSAWCSPSGLGNHDLGYATSPDGGLTWNNNDGEQIAQTGSSDLISIGDRHVVVPIPINQGMINQEVQTFDNRGRIHVMTSQFNDEDLAKLGGCHNSTYPQRAQYARPFHHWRTIDGTWHSMELPFYSGSAGRTKILFDKHDTAYVVLPDARIVAATAATGWSDWRIVFEAKDVDNIAELIVDRQRLNYDGVLSVAYEEESSDGAPSAFRVADFRIKPGGKSQPKATQPVAPPVPYEGSVVTYPLASASSSQAGFPPDLAVDQSSSTFWVSGGTAEGQGPQPSHPETLTVEYGKVLTITQVTVTPRVDAGPRSLTLEARVNGVWQRLGDYQQANAEATYDIPATQADAVRLVITSSYDKGRAPEKTRNVQVAEVSVS